MIKYCCYVPVMIFLTAGNSAHSQWYAQPSGTTARLSSVYFINEYTGWISGFEIVLKTTDSGQTWQIDSLAGYHNGIHFTTASNGLICSDNGLLYRTTDAGSSWTLRQTGTTSHLMSIEFLNQNTGLIAGSGDLVLKTTNGGLNWNNVFADSGYYLFSSDLVNENVYYVAATLGTIFKTVNGGLTWTALSVNMVNPFFTVRFINENTGWAFGCCGMYFYTTNGGSTWTELQYLTFGATLLSSVFVDGNTGWSVGAAGNIVRTTNGGGTWDSLVSGTTNTLYSIFFVNNSTGWTVGYNGTILKTTNGGGTGYVIGIEKTGSEIPKQFSLNQNYPNPFNPSTTIRYEVPLSKGGESMSPRGFSGEGLFISLLIYDALGRQISTLVNSELSPGSYVVEWNAADYPSGIYFCRLSAYNYSETRRMVLLK